jgi:hypothetical protein
MDLARQVIGARTKMPHCVILLKVTQCGNKCQQKNNCKIPQYNLFKHRKTPFRLTKAYSWLPNAIK